MLFNSVRQFIALQRILSAYDALQITLNPSREIVVFLRDHNRKFTLRGGTTDLNCFEKVFRHLEYNSPFHSEDPALIVDGGANIGTATLYFALKYPSAKIIAIEPELENFKLLARNCAGLPNVELRQAALWPTSEKLELSNPFGKEAWSFAVNIPRDGIATINSITIDQIIEQTKSDRIDI